MENTKNLVKNEKNTISDFVELVDQELLFNMMEKIANATGMGIAAVDYYGNPAAGCTGYSSFCMHVQKDVTRKRACETSTGIGEIQAATTQEPYIYVCPNGLLEVSIPIVIDGKFLGGFVAGQIRCDDIPDSVNRLASIFPQDIICSEAFAEEFQQVTKMTFREFKATAQMSYFLITEFFQAKAEGINKNTETSVQLKKALKEDEITILRLQTDREFLTKSIISIANMAAVEDAVKTNEMAGVLSRFLWDTTEENENSCFLCNELETMKCYLLLQQQQIDGLEFEFDIPEDIMLQRIPTMLLLPLVEQALHCGLRYKKDGGTIRIKARCEDEFVNIWVSDNGLGIGYKELKALFPQSASEYSQDGGKSGVKRVKERLDIIFPHNYTVNVEMRRGEGSQYFVQYPHAYVEGEE